MAYEIINTTRGSSIVRAVDVSTANLALTQFRGDPTHETVGSITIRKLNWSTNGSIQIVRNSVPILQLHNTGTIQLDELNHVIANNNTQSIVITVNTGGSLVMEVTKEATYATAPGGF